MRKLFLIMMFPVLAIICCGCSSTESKSFRVMTYNIHHAQGTDGVLDINRIADVISAAGPDIVALNEVDKNFSSRSEFQDQPRLIAKALDMNYVYGPTLESGPDDNPKLYGNAVLSRYPVMESKNYNLANSTGEEPRCALLTKINIGNKVYAFIATHLNHRNPNLRQAQGQSILEIIKDVEIPVILAGDFNCPPGKDAAGIISQRLESSFATAGSGSRETYGNSIKIDYIFISPELKEKVISAKVIRTETTDVASDHLPLIADIRK